MTKLDRQLDRFIKSGFKYSTFTKDLYEALHIDTNVFIAHFNRERFHKVRFQESAEQTIYSLMVVRKPELRGLCVKLARAMANRLYRIESHTCTSSVVDAVVEQKKGA